MARPIHTCPKDGSFFILIDGSDCWLAWWDKTEKTYPLRFIDGTHPIRDTEEDADGILANGYPADVATEENPNDLFWHPWPTPSDLERPADAPETP